MCKGDLKNSWIRKWIYSKATDAVVQPHLMILLQAPQTGVLPVSSGACWAAWRMELRFSMGVGWAGCWCWVNTVLVLSGRKRSAKLGSVTHGGREEGPEWPPVATAVLEPKPKADRSILICRFKKYPALNQPTTQIYVLHFCWSSRAGRDVALVLTLNKNLLAQMLLGFSLCVSRSINSPSGLSAAWATAGDWVGSRLWGETS